MSEAVCGTAAVTSPVVAGVGGGGPETRVLLLDPVATRPRGTGRLTGLGGGGPAGGPLVPNGAEASAPELGDSVDSSVGAEVAFALAALALALDLPALPGLVLRDRPRLASLGGMSTGEALAAERRLDPRKICRKACSCTDGNKAARLPC